MGHPDEPGSLASLPNELILHVLVCLRTADLVPLACISRRFHDLIVRILSHRLHRAACQHSHAILLESYFPSQRLTEPPYPCRYLGTNGLDDGALWDEPTSGLAPGQRLRELSSMYSRFRPHRRQVERVNPMKHPAGDVPGSRTYVSAHDDPNRGASNGQSNTTTEGASGSSSSEASAERPSAPQPQKQDPKPTRVTYEPVIQRVHLEAGVRFNQLCVHTSVTMAGPIRGLFVGYQYVDQGVLRVFREWLADRAAIEAAKNTVPNSLVADENKDIADIEVEDTDPQIEADSRCETRRCSIPDFQSDRGILWVGIKNNVGLRFGVKQPTWRPQHSPILVRTDEDLPVTYEIEYEELLVRTTDLLLATEKADHKQQSASSKAIVIGHWTVEG